MHVYEHIYGKRASSPVIRVAEDLLATCYRPTQGPLRLLDIGCGNMDLSRAVAEGIRTPSGQPCDFELEGWDLSQAAVAQAKEAGYSAQVRDITAPLHDDEHDLYDMVLFLEVIEHLVDTDTAIQQIRRLLKPDGVLVLSTPNLASWFNRLFLLVGNQPHCTEVSFAPYRFGNRLVHRLLGEEPGKSDVVAGHLRVFTWKALKEFLGYHGMDIVAVRGCSNHKYDLVTKLLCRPFPGLAGDICLVARKAADNPGADALTRYTATPDSR